MECDKTHIECKFFEEIAGSRIGVCINEQGQKFFGATSFYGSESICKDENPCPVFLPKKKK